MLEVETKYRFDDHSRMLEFKNRFLDEYVEKVYRMDRDETTDYYYVMADDHFRRLRYHHRRGSWLLTEKGSPIIDPVTGFKTRSEVNEEISAPDADSLKAAHLVIEKTQECYHFGNAVLSFDEVAGLGYFSELEYLSEDNSLPVFDAKLLELLPQFGIPENRSYQEMAAEKLR